MHDLPSCDQSAKRLHLQGRVQGIGLRPAVLRWATICKVAGWVANDATGVHIHAEGRSSQLEQFVSGLVNALPGDAVVSNQMNRDVQPEGHDHFVVKQSTGSIPLTTAVPLDNVICPQCLVEIQNKHDARRFQYLFNSCASCGPRYSIVQTMPFEREQTAMAEFPLCPACSGEFTDPCNRRFHAQTTSCRNCGPAFFKTISDERKKVQTLAAAVAAIVEGKVLAVKGLGGYQLICDATSDTAVSELRQRKSRQTRPLAVMVKDIDLAWQIADISECQTALTTKAGPIVLYPARPRNGLSHLVHPGLRDVGIMLPTTAMHYLLCEMVNKPLIVTSGNRDGEPLAYEQTAAVQQLGSLCDILLHHDRAIIRPVDDSVVKPCANAVASIRLGRGMAPHTLPIKLTRSLVALGGQQKVALALSNRYQAILGPHIGDMDTVACQSRFIEQYHQLCSLYDVDADVLVHDLHPDYFTTRWAEGQGNACVAVQHHHAHVAAGMLEHGLLHKRVLGIAFDGTGLGEDGTIWGGEFLLATASEYKRQAHLRPFKLPGSEQAVRQPNRVALSLLDEVNNRTDLIKQLERLKILENYRRLLPLLDTSRLHVRTSSAGRLFDGVASLLLSIYSAHYEGEPAMLLEACCDRSATGSYDFPLVDYELDWRPMLRAIVIDMERGVEPGIIAMRFHRSMAQAIVTVIHCFPQYPVVLTGGCFQNRILVELVRDLLDDTTRLGVPGIIPCNDGGLAAGQLVVAAARLNCLSL